MSIAYCRTLFFNLYSKYVVSFYNGKQRRAKDIVGTAEVEEDKTNDGHDVGEIRDNTKLYTPRKRNSKQRQVLDPKVSSR